MIRTIKKIFFIRKVIIGAVFFIILAGMFGGCSKKVDVSVYEITQTTVSQEKDDSFYYYADGTVIKLSKQENKDLVKLLRTEPTLEVYASETKETFKTIYFENKNNEYDVKKFEGFVQENQETED